MEKTNAEEIRELQKKKKLADAKEEAVKDRKENKDRIDRDVESMIKEVMSIWKRSRDQTLNLLITLGYDAFKDNQRFNNSNLFAKTFEQFVASERFKELINE